MIHKHTLRTVRPQLKKSELHNLMGILDFFSTFESVQKRFDHTELSGALFSFFLSPHCRLLPCILLFYIILCPYWAPSAHTRARENPLQLHVTLMFLQHEQPKFATTTRVSWMQVPPHCAAMTFKQFTGITVGNAKVRLEVNVSAWVSGWPHERNGGGIVCCCASKRPWWYNVVTTRDKRRRGKATHYQSLELSAGIMLKFKKVPMTKALSISWGK